MKVSDNNNVVAGIVLATMYILGVIADAIGHINWLINTIGIIFECAAMYFIVANIDLLYEHGHVKLKRTAIISISCIIGGILSISILFNCNMIVFFISMGVFITTNIIVLIVALSDFFTKKRGRMELEKQNMMCNNHNNEREEQSNCIDIIIK